MDFALTDSYRVATEDLTLLYDIYMLCKNSRYYQMYGYQRLWKDNFKDYINVMKYVMREENLDETKLAYHIDENSINYEPRSNDLSRNRSFSYNLEVSDVANTNSSSVGGMNDLDDIGIEMGDRSHSENTENTGSRDDKTFGMLVWYYTRTVILQFLVEEGSQFPFWATKASVILNDDVFDLCNSNKGPNGVSISFPRLWFSALKLRWENGFWEGLLPFLGATFCMNIDTLWYWSRRFTLTSIMPRINVYGSRSVDRNKNSGLRFQVKNEGTTDEDNSQLSTPTKKSNSPKEDGDDVDNENGESDALAQSDSTKSLKASNSGEFTWNPVSRTYSDEVNSNSKYLGSSGSINKFASDSSYGNSKDDLKQKLNEKNNSSSARGAQGSSITKSFRYLGSCLPTRLSFSQMSTRMFTSILSHPFYMVALLMVKDQTLRYISNSKNSNSSLNSAVIGLKDINPLTIVRNFNLNGSNKWWSVLLEIAAQKGFIFCIYRGLRSVLAANLIPYHFGNIIPGVIETLLFRRMIRPIHEDELSDIRDLSKNAHIPQHTRITSTSLTAGSQGLFLEAQTMIRKHGVWSLTAYACMTALQIIPGYFNFISSRILLFLTLGPSQIRERQLRRRKELVASWIKRTEKKRRKNMDVYLKE